MRGSNVGFMQSTLKASQKSVKSPALFAEILRLRSAVNSANFAVVEGEKFPGTAQKINADSGLDALLTVA